MNQKKSKAIRRLVRSMGKVNAELPLHIFNPSTHKLVKQKSLTSIWGFVVTAKYPENSFQAVHKAAKRMLGRVGLDVIRVQTATNIARA